MPKVLSYIEELTTDDRLQLEADVALEAVLGVRRIGPDLQWQIVVSREFKARPTGPAGRGPREESDGE